MSIKKKRYCSSVPAGDYVTAEFVNLLAIPLPLLGVRPSDLRPPLRSREPGSYRKGLEYVLL